MLIKLKLVSELFRLLSDVTDGVDGTAAITIEQNDNTLYKQFSFSSQHYYNNNIEMVCILVRHFILFTMGYRMAFGTAWYLGYISTKKIIGGSSFCSSMMPFISSSIFWGDPPVVVITSYP